MKRYRFRLDPVLAVRRREEDAARGALVAAAAAVRLQQDLLAGREAAYADALNASGSRACADFLHEQAHRSALGQALLDQRARLGEARDQEERARQQWSAAAARVGALERLDERRRAEHLLASQKEEDLIVDELVVSRYARTAP